MTPAWPATTATTAKRSLCSKNYRDAADGEYNPDFDPPYRDDRASHPMSDITWNVENITIRNNVLANGERRWSAMLLVADAQKVVSPDAMNIKTDHNRYHRDSPGSSDSPNWVVGWGTVWRSRP